MTAIRTPGAALAVLCLFAAAGTANAEQTLELRVGEMRSLEVGAIARIAVNEPAVLDARPLTAESLAIEAVGEGSSWLRVWRKDGSRVSFTVVVKGAAPPKSAEARAAKLPPPAARGDAHCDARPRDPAAARAFEAGPLLLKQKELRPALAELEKARALEPAATVVLLYLGTCYAQLQRIAEGAGAYEAFASSCPAHPSAPAVRDILRSYRQASGNR